MRLETRKYLYDIQPAAGLIREFTANKTSADYQREPMLRLAVERAFAIIGWAMSQLAKLDAGLAGRFSEFGASWPFATFSSMILACG